jgi:serine O-acetyltransferase
MNREFYQHIYHLQQKTEAVPPNDKIAHWALQLICLLYPERASCFARSAEEIEHQFHKLEMDLVELLDATKACREDNNVRKAKTFFAAIPELYRLLNTDIEAILDGDPAAHTRFEVIRAATIASLVVMYGSLKVSLLILPCIIARISKW